MSNFALVSEDIPLSIDSISIGVDPIAPAAADRATRNNFPLARTTYALRGLLPEAGDPDAMRRLSPEVDGRPTFTMPMPDRRTHRGEFGISRSLFERWARDRRDAPLGRVTLLLGRIEREEWRIIALGSGGVPAVLDFARDPNNPLDLVRAPLPVSEIPISFCVDRSFAEASPSRRYMRRSALHALPVDTELPESFVRLEPSGKPGLLRVVL